MGHLKNYAVGDAVAHFHRRTGRRVLHPIGYDAFGLPAENHAIRTGEHPRDSTAESIAPVPARVPRVGGLVRLVARVRAPAIRAYYRWTQWLFLRFLERGLAYRKEAAVNWCPKDATVLANEQVIDGRCERCGTPVEARQLEQWFFRITDYADRLLDDLATVDWPEHVGHDAAQLDRPLRGRRGRRSPARSWASTTRSSPPARTRCSARRSSSWRPSIRTCCAWRAGTEHEQAVRDYVNAALTEDGTERGATEREKTGVPLGPHRRQPRQRRADPDVGRRLRADGVRHRRDHGGARARRARLRLRDEVRARDPARDRGRRASSPTRATARSSTRIRASTGCTTARRSTRSSPGSTARAAGTARSTTACATGCSRASATGAARSRSCTATAAASCPFPTTSCR